MGDKVFKLFIIFACVLLGFGFSKFYQPYGKTVKIYTQALKDFDNQNYSNAYYLFSKVGYSSNLKPIAIYRQALCAKALGDKASELNRYKALFRNYPKHKFALVSKYHAAKLSEQEYPDSAKKYFNDILKSDLEEDYKIASNYYLAKIEYAKLRREGQDIPQEKKTHIEAAFRQYLQKYSDGRLSSEVAQQWQKLSSEINPQDMLLIAKALYYAGENKQADEILKKLDIKSAWAVKALNSFALKDFESAKSIMSEGIDKYAKDADYADEKKVIDEYLKSFDGDAKLRAIVDLKQTAKTPVSDYVTYLYCGSSKGEAQYSCYKNLYASTAKSEYTEEALYKIFEYMIQHKNYSDGKTVAKEFLSKFPKSKYAPMVTFWAAKIEQMYGTADYMMLYNNIIANYPDSYYAYRAFWIIKGVKTPSIRVNLNYKPVEYPYRFPAKGTVAYNLIQVKDYKMLSEYIDDDFIKSWGEYQSGNYTTSLNLAKTAMDKIYPKPPKTDLRWRLVYPQNYFKQVHTYSQKENNDDALIMSIIRTESSFNSEAQSSVGAVGLMQLMPATAHEVGKKIGMELNTNYLFNPEINIKLGNVYYSDLKKMTKNDLYAVASYNGGFGSVNMWKNKLKYYDIDEFVEQIPYEETKNYIKKVFGSYWNYVKIYQQL